MKMVNAFSQFDNFSAARVRGNRHMARRIEVDSNPADFIENGYLNFNHLSVWKSFCDTIRKLLKLISFLVNPPLINYNNRRIRNIFFG